MISSRIIPCLLMKSNGLVKTVKFKNGKYIGDPINAIRIYNEKKVDEIILLDIEASALDREPNYKLIETVAAECRMPFCYGGGIDTVEKAQRILSLGVEKIAVSTAAVKDIGFIKRLAESIGSQSVVVVIDVKSKMLGGYDILYANGKKKSGLNLDFFIAKLQRYGVGEIVVNSIDNDGTCNGYDLKLIDSIKDNIRVPLTILGGAGSLKDLSEAENRYGSIGLAAGSLFVYKGRYKAVLINYRKP